MATSKDVARLAGVSSATVSRTLHNSPLVTEETKQRVLEAIRKTGYRPNLPARSLRTRRTGIVGVVVPDLLDPFYPELVRALNGELAAADLRMILWDSQGSSDQAAVEALEQGQVDGLIVATATSASSVFHRVLNRRAAIVNINRVIQNGTCDQIESDNESGARAVAQYFATWGRTNVGLIGGPDYVSTARTRASAFQAQAAECGLQLDPANVVNGNGSRDGGFVALQAMMRGSSRPTAVFCVNDYSAFGALAAAQTLGIKVPEDLWIVGYDDVDMATYFNLTTVRQQIPEMAKGALQMLTSRIEKPRAPFKHVKLACELVCRGSTANEPVVKNARKSNTGRSDNLRVP
jgi:LacI family transcriptional regulator